MEASSWAMRAPRSFLASSSRSMISIFIFLPPTWMPPAALISAMASFAPSRVEAPMGAEPPSERAGDGDLDRIPGVEAKGRQYESTIEGLPEHRIPLKR